MASRTQAYHRTLQGLGNLTYAFAKLGHHPGPLLGLLAAEADRRLPELNNFDCINIVWGFAKLGNYSLQAKLALKNILLALTQSLAQPGELPRASAGVPSAGDTIVDV